MGKRPSYVLHAFFGSTFFDAPVQARGAVLGALSTANTTFSAPIELQESLKLSYGTASPYIKRSTELMSYAEGLRNVPVPGSLGVSEAASLFDVWMKDQAIPHGAQHFFFGPWAVPSGLIVSTAQ